MHRRGFSLAALLLLTAVVAVFLAAVCSVWLRPDADQEQVDVLVEANPDEPFLAVGVVGGMAVGWLVGLVIGACQVRPLPGAILGMLVGMIAGAASGALLAVPGNVLPIAVGSLVIVLFGVVVRCCSDRPPR